MVHGRHVSFSHILRGGRDLSQRERQQGAVESILSRTDFAMCFATPPSIQSFSTTCLIYDDGRCGFFHDGMLRERILFSEQFEAEFVVTVPKIEGKPDQTGPIASILINPRSFAGPSQGILSIT